MQIAIVLGPGCAHKPQAMGSANVGDAAPLQFRGAEATEQSSAASTATAEAAATCMHALICSGPVPALLQQASTAAAATAEGGAAPHTAALFCAPLMQASLCASAATDLTLMDESEQEGEAGAGPSVAGAGKSR